MLAPIGVLGGHALSGLVQHAAGTGSFTAAATVVIGFVLLASWACARQRRPMCSRMNGAGLTRQLVAQGVLFGVIEVAGLGASVAGFSGASLHGPVIMVGVACQVVAAIVAHQVAGLVAQTVARLHEDGPFVRAVAAPSDRAASTAPNPFLGSPVPRSITGRAPPVLRVLSPIRS